MRLTTAPRNKPASLTHIVARTTLLGALVLLGACNLRPEPITAEQHLDRARADFAALQKNYIPHEGKLDLATAIARTLKYNYDTQLAKAETTLQERQVDLAFAQMLPRLAADAGYNWRNNHNSARSVAERTGLQSLDYSYSEEPRHGTADLELSWNLLDAGVSYFQAKQQGYRALVALERRRKVIENILRSVTDTYWRAAAAEELGFAASLCDDHPPGTVLALARTLEDGAVRERFRSLHRRDTAPVFALVEAPEEAPEFPDLTAR
jgi:hypothetical protein